MVPPPAKDKRRPSWSRHFEGWQAGALLVTMAALGTLLGLPRPVAPRDIPLPRVDRDRFAHDAARFRAAADAARRDPLPFTVRAVGEAYRTVGRAEAADNRPALVDAAARLRALGQTALVEQGAPKLLALRSVQTELFIRAVSRWETTGAESAELAELGGEFTRRAERSGWLDESGRLRAEADELASVFIVRWTGLVGALDDETLRPTLNTWRLYFRFQLEHGAAAAAPIDRTRFRIETVRALSRRDPAYPVAFALGVLAFELENFADARDAFRAHLSEHPDGPWSLRARNHLAAALVGVGSAPP